MAGYLGSDSSPKYKPTLSFLISPKFLSVFSLKAFYDVEAVISPTSILDSKSFSRLKNPFRCEASTKRAPEAEPKHYWEKFDSQNIGLGIVNALGDEKTAQILSKPESRMVLFGSQLKIQIPALPSSDHSLAESPRSPAEFSIKNRSSHMSQCSANDSSCGSASSGIESLNRSLSLKEMELSEEYTCIICHGPNPGTTHIFDDCIIERCCGVVGLSELKRENEFLADGVTHPCKSILNFCYTCKKSLEGKDIFCKRGEKASCSQECRNQEILLETEVEKMEPDDAYGSATFVF